MAKLIAKTYGDALFEVGIEKNMVDSLSEEVKAVSDILDQNKELNQLLSHPQIMVEEKQSIIKNIFQNRISDELYGFLQIIIQKGRQTNIREIFAWFEDRVKQYHHIGVVYVTTPLALKKMQKTAIEKKILATTEYESLEMNYQLDPSLIGGMVIRIGDRVVDGSIKNKLDKLSRELGKIQLT